jgi:hypothetical protein
LTYYYLPLFVPKTLFHGGGGVTGVSQGGGDNRGESERGGALGRVAGTLGLGQNTVLWKH